jgi:hypothetical protein
MTWPKEKKKAQSFPLSLSLTPRCVGTVLYSTLQEFCHSDKQQQQQTQPFPSNHSSIASPLFSTLTHSTKSSITLGQLLSSVQKLRLSSWTALSMKLNV